MPSQTPRKKMEGKSHRINTIQLNGLKIKISELNLDDIKKHSHMLESPTTSKAVIRRSSSERWNCLCSPTKHVGSFRCRHHRSAGMHYARSIGSNLSSMGSKDSLQAQ